MAQNPLPTEKLYDATRCALENNLAFVRKKRDDIKSRIKANDSRGLRGVLQEDLETLGLVGCNRLHLVEVAHLLLREYSNQQSLLTIRYQHLDAEQKKKTGTAEDSAPAN